MSQLNEIDERFLGVRSMIDEAARGQNHLHAETSMAAYHLSNRVLELGVALASQKRQFRNLWICVLIANATALTAVGLAVIAVSA